MFRCFFELLSIYYKEIQRTKNCSKFMIRKARVQILLLYAFQKERPDFPPTTLKEAVKASKYDRFIFYNYIGGNR